MFKASDYRISPFELESVLIEHPAVAEAAIVPSPDPLRLAVPKAYVVLAAGHEPTEQTARSILEFARDNLAPYKRIRRLEFAELPKTISGKIRRVELRGREAELHVRAQHGAARRSSHSRCASPARGVSDTGGQRRRQWTDRRAPARWRPSMRCDGGDVEEQGRDRRPAARWRR